MTWVWRLTGGDKRRQIRQSSIQLLAAARPSSIQLFNMLHAHTLYYTALRTHQRPGLLCHPILPRKKRPKKYLQKITFSLFVQSSIIWRNGAKSKRKTSLVPPGKNLQQCQYTGHFFVRIYFTCRIASGWRMVFKVTTLDPDSNCNWVITKLSTLFGKLECEAFNSKVTFYITFILHFLHLLPPSL